MSRIKNLREEALAMHKEYQGKIEVRVKAPVRDNDDLTLAYSPGVAEPCMMPGPSIACWPFTRIL